MCANNRSFETGASLLAMMFIALFLVLLFILAAPRFLSAQNSATKSTNALQNAKQLLMGKVLSSKLYADFFPLPDLGNGSSEGDSSAIFSADLNNLSVLGRLPWKSLGSAPFLDATNECLWFAISASAKQKPSSINDFNWDTIGHFVLVDEAGKQLFPPLVNGVDNPHERALAVLFAPNAPINAQNRAALNANKTKACGGNYVAQNYLDTVNGFANFWQGENSALGVMANDTPKQLIVSNPENKAHVNDLLLTISPQEIAERIIKRPDFAANLNGLLNFLGACLNSLSVDRFPLATGSKGFEDVFTHCDAHPPNQPNPPISITHAKNLLNTWRDNFFYSGKGNFLVNGQACNALILFGGARNKTQRRSNNTEKNNAAMYLEGQNASSFPLGGAYLGKTSFDKNAPANDLVLCITGLNAEIEEFSLETDGQNLAMLGNSATFNSATQSIKFSGTAKATGGCTWLPQAFVLDNKILRAYYEYQFSDPDLFAIDGKKSDRGYGFTLQWVQSENLAKPDLCGRVSDSGALNISDKYGTTSHTIEHDVRKSAAGDPTANHLAILLNGNFAHSGDIPSIACNGTKTGCALSPANTFEESPTPFLFRTRVEVQTRCNANCSVCEKDSAANYALIKAWGNCVNCDNLTSNFLDNASISRCVALNPKMHAVFIGLTGGFLSGATTKQSVTISRFRVRIE